MSKATYYAAWVDKTPQSEESTWERLREKRGGYSLTIYQVRKRKKQAKANGWAFKSNMLKKAPVTKPHTPGAPDYRGKLVQEMDWMLAHEPAIHYLQRRPMHVDQVKNHQLPMWSDCSESTTELFRAVGLPDPNNNGYNGSGFTGTLRRTSNRKSFSDLKPGDYIVYGGGSGSHVVMVYKKRLAGGYWVFSHGQESGPKLYTHDTENSVHGGYFTCHDALADLKAAA